MGDMQCIDGNLFNIFNILLDSNLLSNVDIHKVLNCNKEFIKIVFSHIILTYNDTPILKKSFIYRCFYISNLIILSCKDLYYYSNKNIVIALNIVKKLIIECKCYPFKFLQRMCKIYGKYLFVNNKIVNNKLVLDNKLNDYYMECIAKYINTIQIYGNNFNINNISIFILLISFNSRNCEYGNALIEIFKHLNQLIEKNNDLVTNLHIVQYEFTSNKWNLFDIKYENPYISNIIDCIFNIINTTTSQFIWPNDYSYSCVTKYYNHIIVLLCILTKVLNMPIFDIVQRIDAEYLWPKYKYMIYILLSYFAVNIDDFELLKYQILDKIKLHENVKLSKSIFKDNIIQYFYFIHGKNLPLFIFENAVIVKFIETDAIHSIFMLYYNLIDYHNFTFMKFKDAFIKIGNIDNNNVHIELFNGRNDDYIELLYKQLTDLQSTLPKSKKIKKTYLNSILYGIVIYMFKYHKYRDLDTEPYDKCITLLIDSTFSRYDQKNKLFTFLFCRICVDLLKCANVDMAMDAIEFLYQKIILKYNPAIKWSTLLGVTGYRSFISEVFEVNRIDSILFPIIIQIIQVVKKTKFDEKITHTMKSNLVKLIKDAGYGDSLLNE
jgi:hypothetical protein